MHPAFFPVLWWSLFIFASFLGYGELLRRALNRREFDDLGWGLKAAWGMAVVLAIGGLLMALSLAVTVVLSLVVIAGVVAAAAFGVDALRKKPPTLSDLRVSWPGLVLGGLAVLAFASSIAWPHHIDPNDDLVCYLMLPVKILQTGTLIEPFSFQRAGTFGGQSLLQAIVMIVGGERNGHVPDRGLAMLVMFGILLGATRGLKGQYAVVRFVLLFAFWFVPVPRISTNGAMVGGCLLAAMLATRELALRAQSKAWGAYLPVGLLMAGACSIRPTFTFVIGAIVFALAVADMWGALRQKQKFDLTGTARPYLVMGGACLVVLLPFMKVLYASNGTPMVPPLSGYVSKAYQTYSFGTPWEDLGAVVAFFTAPTSLGMMALWAVAALYPVRPGTRVILGAALFACAVILHRFSALAYLDQYRYLYPIVAPIGLWYVCALLKHASEQNNAKPDASPVGGEALQVPVAVAALALCGWMFVNATQAGGELREQASGIPAQIKEVKPFFDPGLNKAYADLQGLVPEGAKILSMVDASYLLNYKRNPIYSINAVGGSSPPPGIPFEKGSKALADYLKGQGIRYVIAVNFDQAVLLYTRKLWTETTRPEWFYPQIWRPRFLDVMKNLDELDKGGAAIAKAGNVRLFDLGP
jgi:hypothetical protein